MSYQAGIFYFDRRPIPDGEAAAVRGWTGHASAASSRSLRPPGVLLAHAASGDEAGAITFDGRLDNRQDLVARLRHVLKDDTGDAALALAAYRLWGAAGLAHLIGDWSLAIWDSARHAIVLASDFAGVRPLYYCVEPGRACWSTRLQPLVDWKRTPEIDDDYMAAFLALTGHPRRTPYRGIFPVSPGHAVEITSAGAAVTPFWRLPVAADIRYKQEAEYDEHLRSLFREAVRCRLPVNGSCLCELSGGLDSSSVVCMAQELVRTGEATPERFVSLSVEHEGSRDAPFYTAVEQHYGLESIHIPAADYPFLTESDAGGVQPAFWGRLLAHAGEISRQAGATAYLTGKLGDDMMGNWSDDSDQVAGLLRAGRAGAALSQALTWSRSLRIPVSWILWRSLRWSLPPAFISRRTWDWKGWPDKARQSEDSIATGFRGRAGSADGTFPSREWTQARPERRRHLRDIALFLDTRKLQAPEPLDHLDFTHPYAHRPLVEFMLSIPADVVCRPGEPRRLMRRAFRDLWPPVLRGRRSKDGFGGVFLDSLRPLAQDLLQAGRPLQVVERGYLDDTSLRRRLERLTLSLPCNEGQLRHVILLELWLRTLDARRGDHPESSVLVEPHNR